MAFYCLQPPLNHYQEVQTMTPEEFKERMLDLNRIDDEEIFHDKADELICEVMTSLGYGEGIEIFDNHAKWYS